MLHGRRILIVEDEGLVALLLKETVREAGGTVVGPVRSNREALALVALEEPDAAILDINIADGDVTPTARVLLDRGTPFAFYTGGMLPSALRAAAPEAPVVNKEAGINVLVEALSCALATEEAFSPSAAGAPVGEKTSVTSHPDHR